MYLVNKIINLFYLPMYVRVVVRWPICSMSWQRRYCWQRVGWRCVLSWS